MLERSIRELRLFYEGDHPVTAIALQNLGFLRLQQGRYEEAAARLEESRRVSLVWLGAEHPLMARSSADQAELARRQGRLTDAIAIGQRTLAHFERLGLSAHPAAIDTHWTLGEALLGSGRPGEAAATLAEGLAMAEQQYIASDPRMSHARQVLARARAAAHASPANADPE